MASSGSFCAARCLASLHSPAMTRIYFVRHGESVANAGGVTMEHAIIPLSPLGVAQAATVAEILDIDPSKRLV